jgi:hypothetical protein
MNPGSARGISIQKLINIDHNTALEHVFIPEINPHCILSQIYALFIEFYYALLLFLFLFFKDMHYNTMIRTFCILNHLKNISDTDQFWFHRLL